MIVRDIDIVVGLVFLNFGRYMKTSWGGLFCCCRDKEKWGLRDAPVSEVPLLMKRVLYGL